MQLHIIYTETEVLVSKRPYASWREIQDAYATYKTSLGPWEQGETVAFLDTEYPDISPSAHEQVRRLVEGSVETCIITFAGDEAVA